MIAFLVAALRRLRVRDGRVRDRAARRDLPGRGAVRLTIVPAIIGGIAIVLFGGARARAGGLRAPHRADGAAAAAARALAAPLRARAGRRCAAGSASRCARRPPATSAMLGAVTWWAFNIAVLWACFHAFGESPPIAVLVQAFFVGMLGEPAADPGRHRRRRRRHDRRARGVRRRRRHGGARGARVSSVRVLAADGAGRDRLLPAARGACRRGGTRLSPALSQALYFVKYWNLTERGMADDVENVIIIGSGPAGYTAALYTARADLSPLVIEGFAWGGLLQQTTDVENYPGYPKGIMGPEMMQELRDQAERFGTRFITDDATRVELRDGGVQTVWIGDEAHRAKAVVLAMGAAAQEARRARRGAAVRPRRLLLRDVRRGLLQGARDGHRRRRRLGDGGGDLPREVRREGARRPPPRRVPRLADHARPRESGREHRVPHAVRAGGVRRRRERRAGDACACATPRRARLRDVPATGAFIAIGHEPQSELVAGQVELDDERLREDRRASRRARRSRACSPPATSSTTPTARRSPPPAPAARPRSTPSGTCATRRRTSTARARVAEAIEA